MGSRENTSWQVRLGRTFFALAVLASGILQLVTGHFVRILPAPPGQPLPPLWLVYLFGVLLAFAGIGLLVFLWVFLVHIPLAVSKHSISELAGVFEALATSGVAFLLAGAWGRTLEPPQ